MSEPIISSEGEGYVVSIVFPIKKRSRLARIAASPKSFLGFYREIRKGSGKMQSAYSAFCFAKLLWKK